MQITGAFLQIVSMNDVVHAFQKEHPGKTVGLITLPPGLLRSGLPVVGAYALEHPPCSK